MSVRLSTVRPAAVESLRIVAVSSTGGAAGDASSWTWVTEYSPTPLPAAASTGNSSPLWYFSGRYCPEVTA